MNMFNKKRPCYPTRLSSSESDASPSLGVSVECLFLLDDAISLFILKSESFSSQLDSLLDTCSASSSLNRKFLRAIEPFYSVDPQLSVSFVFGASSDASVKVPSAPFSVKLELLDILLTWVLDITFYIC